VHEGTSWLHLKDRRPDVKRMRNVNEHGLLKHFSDIEHCDISRDSYGRISVSGGKTYPLSLHKRVHSCEMKEHRKQQDITKIVET